MRRVFVLVLLALTCSCIRVDEEGTLDIYAKVDVVSPNVYVEVPSVISGSRSSYSLDDLSRLTDLNIYMYHNGKLLKDYSGYFNDVSTLMLAFPLGKDGFNIYMFGNVGRCDAPDKETDIGAMQYVVGEYDEFRVKGVPVAGVFKDFHRGDLADFPLKRLVGQFDIRMRQSAMSADYCIKDVRVMNCALDVYPFSYDQKARLFSRSYQYAEKSLGDVLTESDIERLNQGYEVSLCFVENLQGELLPGNTDRKAKIPSSLPSEVAECCTYIEITADVTTQVAKYTNARFRFYPGENETTDFTIRRNTLYEVVMDFTQNMVFNQEWRIEASDPEVVDLWVDKESAMVIKGAEDMILVRALDNDGKLLDLDVGLRTSSGYINVAKEIVTFDGYDCLGLRITSNVDLTGLYPMGREPSYLTETIRLTSKETFNGQPLLVKDIPVCIYYKLFPLLVTLEKKTSSSPYSIVLRSRNPMGLGVSVSSSYVVDGQSYTTGRCSACNYDYMDKGNRVSVVDAVGVGPKYFGELAVGVRYDNLASINLEVSGVSNSYIEKSESSLRYPKLLADAQKLFTGDDSKAFFGPGSGQVPASGYPFYDDELCRFHYVLLGETYEYLVTEEYGATVAYGGLMPLCMCYNGHTYMNVGDKHCYGYAKVTGCNEISFDSANSSLYEALPFYIVNASMRCQNTIVIPTGSIGNWNNKTTRGVIMEFLAPGRDLFAETESVPVEANRRHTLEFMIEIWKNFFGKVQTHQYSRHYTGGSYMTVNGASAWVGGDISDYGVSADDI